MKNEISTQPYKGTKDFLPEDQLVQEFIFDTWKEVCLKFGYKEYQTPLLEQAEIYRAKSGEDLGGKELFTLTDLAGRELAIRPEMTPSVTRMVSKIYNSTPKPIRLFNISNFCRNERPQKGRNREFWQLNADIFGEDSINADIEILTLALEIMLAFNPPANAFKLFFNNRKLIDSFFSEVVKIPEESRQDLMRQMDKYEKYESDDDFIKALLDKGFDSETITKTINFLKSDNNTLLSNFPELENTEGASEILYVQKTLSSLGYGDFIQFKTTVIRGMDYYDRIIFEVFDMNPENNRSLFGGGSYNGLSKIYGIENMPATGFAPGNETFRIFLENWGLIPELNKYQEIIYFPLLEGIEYVEALEAANVLRARGNRVQLDLKTTSIAAALRNANRLGVEKVALYGRDEKENNNITVKNMNTGDQKIEDLNK